MLVLFFSMLWSKIKAWAYKNKNILASVIPTVLLVGMILFHFFDTRNPPITQPVIISPLTHEKVLDNGQKVQVKAHTPSTESPEQAGFSEAFVHDTINKIIGVKNKEILTINQIKGTYKDSLQFVKEELDEKQRVVKYYESRDSKGNVIGSGKTVGDNELVYSGNVDVTSILKKAPNKKSLDSLIFYDSTGRFTVNKSYEYSYPVPRQKVKQKITISAQAGAGVVVPNFDTKRAGFGGYAGLGVSYNF